MEQAVNFGLLFSFLPIIYAVAFFGRTVSRYMLDE